MVQTWWAAMNIRLLVSSVVALVMAVACTANVGAENPQQADGEPAGWTSPVATSVPATAAPATVTGVAATAPAPATPMSPVSVPTATPRSDVPIVAPTMVPQSLATSTPVPTNPLATPTPLWTAVPSPTPIPTLVPTPTATVPPVQPTISAAPVEQFSSLLDHRYDVPAGWIETRTESSILITDPSGKITLTIAEKSVDRWRYQTVASLGSTQFPERPAGWDLWVLNTVGLIKVVAAYEFQFSGNKGGAPYLQFVHWYMWGDVHVSVSAEVPAFDWSTSSKVRSDVGLMLDSFTPHTGTNLLTEQDVLASLRDRLDDRASGINGRNEELQMGYEMSCRDIYNNLVMQPEYLGTGLWQVVAPTLQGVETWWVFEPGASIMPLNSNQSRC